VIRPDPEARTSYLQRQVPVAKVPGNAQQVWRFGAFDFKDWLGGGAYAQITAAVEFEAVAVDQVMRPRQVEEIGLPRIGDQANAFSAIPSSRRWATAWDSWRM